MSETEVIITNPVSEQSTCHDGERCSPTTCEFSPLSDLALPSGSSFGQNLPQVAEGGSFSSPALNTTATLPYTPISIDYPDNATSMDIQELKLKKMAHDLGRGYRDSYKTRYRGYESNGPAPFYDSVVSANPVKWIDRVQVRVDLARLPFNPLNFSFFQSPCYMTADNENKVNDPFHYGINDAYRLPNTVIRVGKQGAKTYLYIDLLVIPLHGKIRDSFHAVLDHLMTNNIIKHGRRTATGIHAESKLLFTYFELNEVEIRFDVLNECGGAGLLEHMGKYFDPQKTGHISITSWANRARNGYLVKTYARGPFTRIEVVLYHKNLEDVSLLSPLTVVKDLSSKVDGIIDRCCQQKPGLRIVVPFIKKSINLKYRIHSLGLDGIADVILDEAQKRNIF